MKTALRKNESRKQKIDRYLGLQKIDLAIMLVDTQSALDQVVKKINRVDRTRTYKILDHIAQTKS